MSEARRRKPPNRWGCKPVEDVCVQHDRPLECRHGCGEAKEHKCKDKETPGLEGADPNWPTGH